MNLYITADVVGLESGGGKVTAHESQALNELGPCEVWGREQLQDQHGVFEPEPWNFDVKASYDLDVRKGYKICHVYAGTFSSTIRKLKMMGCKVTYTAAAHDVQKSRQAHEELGVPYNYPHLTDPALWERYLGGYKAADVLICPSQHSAAVMRGFGCTNRIEVIPHGVDMPKCKECGGAAVSDIAALCQCNCKGSGVEPIASLPELFVVGYLGAMGCDKGVIDLLRAWAQLNYQDAVLALGGGHSQSPFVQRLIEFTGARNVVCTGWVKDVADFYNACSLYVQPSMTEGFGIEVLEAMAHGRAVISSDGAGAADVLEFGMIYPAGDVDALAREIDLCYQNWKLGGTAFPQIGPSNRVLAERYTWNKVREKYKKLWLELLSN